MRHPMQHCLLFGVILCVGCSDRGRGYTAPVPERQSPQAQVVPAPLGQPVDSNDAAVEASRAVTSDALAPEDMPLPIGQKAFPVLMSFRSEGQQSRLVGQLGSSRMWLRSSGDEGFVMPYPFELRARADRAGHLLLWEANKVMRFLSAGGLRPFFADGSFDVAPLASVLNGTEAVRQAPAARVHIQMSKRAGVGDAGFLLVKMLAEFAQATPSLMSCSLDEFPSKLVYEWQGEPHESMMVTVELGAKQEPFVASSWPVPPPGGAWATRREYPPVRLKGAQERFMGASDSGALTVTNRTNLRRLVLLDGTPVAWLGAGESVLLDAVRKGSYPLDCRSFWGDERLPGTVAQVPGKVSCGDLPAR